MSELILVLWQLAGLSLVLGLWAAATAHPALNARLPSWDVPILGAIALLCAGALVMGVTGLFADRVIIYAPLGITLVLAGVVVAVASLWLFHAKALDRAGPALTAFMMPVLLALGVAGALVVVRTLMAAFGWAG